MPPDLSVVICTYKRPALLAEALASLARQRPAAGARFDVVVADNSDDGSAAEAVREARERLGLEIAYVEAHPPNISVARNAGVAAATGRAIAFVDDDQTLDEGWFEAVMAGLSSFPHDGFFGRVEAAFETPERATPAIRQLFSRDLDAAAGTELRAYGARNPGGAVLATNNAILRRDAIQGPAPFDPAFGDGGGEDFDFFCRLQRGGGRFAWLPDARAQEFVPAARCDPGYMRRRLFAGGQAYSAAVASLSPRPRLAAWTIRAKAAAQAGLLALQGPAALARGTEARLDYGFRWAGVLGKFAGGRLYPVYREADGRKPPSA